MKRVTIIVELLFLVTFVSIGCRNESRIKLIKIESFSTAIVDTIERIPERQMYIVQATNYKGIREMNYYCAIIKKTPRGDVLYKLDLNGDNIRISKDLIASVKKSDRPNWGWFNIENGTITNKLPNIEFYEDSIKSLYNNNTPKDIFVSEKNGMFSVYSGGRLIELIHYGSIITPQRGINFDSLGYNLYKFENNNYHVVSSFGDDIFKQSNGLFYIPPPGYGVIQKFNKHQIINWVDSVSNLKKIPNSIIIHPVK